MVVRGVARVKVDEGEFQSVLEDVDDAVGFFEERSEITARQQEAQKVAQKAATADRNNGNINNNNYNPNADAMAVEDEAQDSAASGSIEYYKRSLALQEACMDLFSEAIAQRISQTSTQVSAALDLKRKSVSGDTLEASLIYTRFHGISSRSRALLNVIRRRKDAKKVLVPASKRRAVGSNASHHRRDMVCPYTQLWDLCRNTYIQSRLDLLRLSVRNHLDFLKGKHGLIGMTRLASVFLMRLCTAETALYLDFFGREDDEEEKPTRDDGESNGFEDGFKNVNVKVNNGGDENHHVNGAMNDKVKAPGATTGTAKSKKKDAATLASQVMSKNGTYYDSEFQTFLDELCNNLHRTIRRGLVSIVELDTLCQIVSVLREERSLANASPTTMAAARSLGKVIVDAQERLIFCANGVLGKEVVRFKATPEDLDYPEKLRKCKEQQEEKKEMGAVSDGNDALKIQMQIYESWFPPIRSVLKVLSKIFRVVEPKVFEDIALSSVQSCTRSLKDGSAYIEKKSGQIHSDLFLVKHLLVSKPALHPLVRISLYLYASTHVSQRLLYHNCKDSSGAIITIRHSASICRAPTGFFRRRKGSISLPCQSQSQTILHVNRKRTCNPLARRNSHS